MDLPWTHEEQRFIEEKLRTGRYKTADDVVRDSLRLWMVQDAAREQQPLNWASEVRE